MEFALHLNERAQQTDLALAEILDARPRDNEIARPAHLLAAMRMVC